MNITLVHLNGYISSRGPANHLSIFIPLRGDEPDFPRDLLNLLPNRPDCVLQPQCSSVLCVNLASQFLDGFVLEGIF